MRLLPLALSLFAPVAYAAEQDRVLESPRFLGRGDTFVAAYDSDEASRGNPAAMADTKVTFQLRPLQLDLMFGDNLYGSLSDITKVSQESSAVSILQTFASKFGKQQYGRIQAAPLAMRFGNFEVMPFVSTSNYIDLRDPALPEVIFKSDSQAGFLLSYAYELSKELSLGVSLRPAYRNYYSGDVAFSDLLTFVSKSNFQLTDLFAHQTGFGVGINAGAMYKPSPEWRFGLLVENLGYAGTFGGGGPPPTPQQIGTGLSYRADWKPWHWDTFADLHDVLNSNQYSYLRLLHLGTEIGRSYFTRDSDIGAEFGVNEGYFTTGGYLDLYIFRLNLSYYAVELGEYPGQRKDRRWGFTLLSSATF